MESAFTVEANRAPGDAPAGSAIAGGHRSLIHK
jgi:hypothetical protein